MHELTIQDWQQRYRNDGADPRGLIGDLRSRYAQPDSAWILLLDDAALEQQFARLDARLADLPGLHLNSNAYRGVSLNDCVLQSRLAAARVLRGL